MQHRMDPFYDFAEPWMHNGGCSIDSPRISRSLRLGYFWKPLDCFRLKFTLADFQLIFGSKAGWQTNCVFTSNNRVHNDVVEVVCGVQKITGDTGTFRIFCWEKMFCWNYSLAETFASDRLVVWSRI